MRILWDLRLYSYGYKTRGVGVFTERMIAAINKVNYKHEIFIWGNENDIPASIKNKVHHIIPYKKGSWISDLFTIPILALRYSITVYHYWIALGPIYNIGLGIIMPCKVCATLYDFAAENICEDPYLVHVRKSTYWAVQKLILHKIQRIVCISQETKQQAQKILGIKNVPVIYMPAIEQKTNHKKRQQVFFTLAGAIHKNVGNVITAFYAFQKEHTEYTLAILGEININEYSCPFKSCIVLEPIDRCEYHLYNAEGYICCSTYEGLGIPALDAMAYSCPLILSDIPVFHETCDEAARFVDPENVLSIVNGMEDIIHNQQIWIQSSNQGCFRYHAKSDNAGKEWLHVYSC